ncbi:MAG TPA: methyltransferase domain-containing protein [Solirubrobacteraceae bacterium]
MQAEELQERIAAYPLWHYQFEFEGGIRTPLVDRARVNRQRQRRQYFFEPLLRLTGGTLEGRRVLDLGCSSGFWALQAIEAGADFVLGLDGRDTYIEQAKLVFEAKGIDPARYRFDQANVFEYDLQERFDVVLCLGLLNVVAKPVALFELISRSQAPLVVLDTGISRAPTKLFELSRLLETRNAIDYGMVLVPSRRAVIDLAGQFGFDALPLALDIADWTSMEDYRRGERLAFMCANGVTTGALALEPEPHRNAWVAAAQRRLRRRDRGR